MSQKCRIIFSFISTILLFSLGIYIKGDLFSLCSDAWFSSGIVLAILLSLIDQPYFSKDSNVFTNAVTAVLALLIVNKFDIIFFILLFVAIYLILSSYYLMWTRSKSLNDESRVIQLISRFNRILGQPLVLFSAIFLWSAMNEFSINSAKFGMLFVFWMAFIVIGNSELSSVFSGLFESKKDESEIGEIFGIQSKNVLLVKLRENRKETIQRYNFVKFRWAVDSNARIGMIIDVYVLNDEQWIKVLSTNGMQNIVEEIGPTSKTNCVYKIDVDEKTDYIKNFVGIVTENSTIERIRFAYNSRRNIKEGDLLELTINKSKVLYQIVQGRTQVEILELKNEFGFIVGEAMQLGEWNQEKGCFEIFGWVPEVNTPVFIATDVDSVEVSESEIEIGKVPSTTYSIVMNKETAVTHHTAILGVTGTGKSVFSRNLISQIACETTKVIVVDLTGEYLKKVPEIKQIISNESSESIFANIESLAEEMSKFAIQRDPANIAMWNSSIKSCLSQDIQQFIDGSDTIGLFDIPEISNSTGNIEYMKYFFSVLFNLAKKGSFGDKRVCVVLEEAHTIIPETTMLAVSDNASKASVNAIAQIALQGRKYNIGFIVIAQRTANVSKTILTQCNSMIVFKELDKTSCDFLSNYMSQDYVQILSTLKSRQAIAVGKAFRSTTPLVFEVPELDC